MEGDAIRRLILHGLWVAPVAAVLLWRVSPLAAVAAVMASHALVLYPTLRPNSQWLGPVATSFRSKGKEVWLTIDDGPSPVTPELLELLDRFDARATFFMVGEHARKFPEAVTAIISRGHTVGNHSQTHPSATFWALGPGAIADEIEGCSDTLREIAGDSSAWLRTPVGMKNPFVHPIARKNGLTIVGWTARGYDAVAGEPDRIVERMRRDIRPGSIILAHEGRALNIVVLARLLKELSADGYRFVQPGIDQFIFGREDTTR